MKDNLNPVIFSRAHRISRHCLILILFLMSSSVVMAEEQCEYSHGTTYGCNAALGEYTTHIAYREVPLVGQGGEHNTVIGALALEPYQFGPPWNFTAVGYRAAFHATNLGGYNVAVGNFSGSAGSGEYKLGLGYSASDVASLSVAIGAFSYSSYEGTATGFSSGGTVYNTANGSRALASNSLSSGEYNTAVGVTALFLNTTGNENTGIGVDAAFSNTTGNYNASLGTNALYYNTTASKNTAIGHSALLNNNPGDYQGDDFLGHFNTAQGYQALYNNTTGSYNVALGVQAGYNLTTGNYNIVLGNKGVAGESNTIRIGKKGTQTATYIAGISGTTVAGGVAVQINTHGRLGTITSSVRYKEAIKPMAKASEAIFSLQPVTFRYKRELDPEGTPQFGLVAEEVAKVDPELVARDEEGRPYTVRYEAVNAMLLNEFLKEHRRLQAIEKDLHELDGALEKHRKVQGEDIAALQSQLKQVTNERSARRAKTRLVSNN